MTPPHDPKAPPPPDTGDPTPHPRYDQPIEGDPFEVMQKYQVVTLPPNARLELMKMKLPEAPAELLQDTVPPNGSVKAPPVASPELGATTDAPVVDHSRSNDTLIIPRVQRQKRLRAIVIAALCAGVALLALGLLVSQEDDPTDTPPNSPAELQVSPVDPSPDRATSVVPAAAPVATGPSLSTPATTPSAAGLAEQRAPSRTDRTDRTATIVPARPTPSSQAPAPEGPKTATPPAKPEAPSARGKEPWIDGL